MQRIFYLLVLTMLCVSAGARQWSPDVLGGGFEMSHVAQGRDYSGEVRCTIVRKTAPCHPRRGILYVHGFNDYFFQREMADKFVGACFSFYAVDLRKYGRSLMAGQKPFEVHDMHEYFADIDSAVAQMKRDGIADIVLMGHSTGGLTTALYMSETPDAAIKALILNSPFLDWNLSPVLETLGIPAVKAVAGLFPGMKIAQGDSEAYARSLLKGYGGEWTFDTSWKFMRSPDVEASWVRAIDNAQSQLRDGSGRISVPVLLMHSDVSVREGDTPEAYASGDGVLDVNDMVRYGRMLGSDVTDLTVPGGVHDLVLSRKGVRNGLYLAMFRWLSQLGLACPCR